MATTENADQGRKAKHGGSARTQPVTAKVELSNPVQSTSYIGPVGKPSRIAGDITGKPRIFFAPTGLHVVISDKAIGKTAVYRTAKGVDYFVGSVSAATPMELIEAEREGVAGIFVKELSKAMDIPAIRMFDILGVPKATVEKKVAAGEVIKGAGGHAALGLVRLLGIAKSIVLNSTAPEAKNFDSAKWLGRWIERPQPALGGRTPADLIDTPTGVEVVARLLGSIESGAYQ